MTQESPLKPGGRSNQSSTPGGHGSQDLPKSNPRRDAALDFTKGVLVLLMVLYHWLNYFVSVEGFGYRYIRFITPSFVFLAGFLVTYLLASRESQKPSSLSARLLLRGAKLLVLFTVLNLGVAWLAPARPSGRATGIVEFIGSIPECYLTGRNTSFFVLVPISYTLMIAALLQEMRFRFRLPESLPTLILFGLVSGVIISGWRTATLELIGSGLLGLILGSALAQRLPQLRSNWLWLTLAYMLHAVALTVWGVPYPLQLISVCLNLGLLYCVADQLPAESPGARLTSLLGQYTLLGYIGQIAILQLLSIVFRFFDMGSAKAPVALAAVLFLVIAGTAAVDSFRRRSPQVDSIYRFVFA